MKKLILALLMITIGLLFVDRTGGLIMNWISSHSKDVLSPKLHYIRNEVSEEIILLGASRCHHHYLPSIIEDSIGTTVYNAGIGGSNNIYSHYIVLNHILKRHTPRLVCLEVMPTDYNLQDNPFSVVSFFAPLFGTNEQADSIYKIAGSYWKYKLSHLYRYNAKAASNIWGLILDRQKEAFMGYMPLPEPKQYPCALISEEKPKDVDSQKIEFINRFISLCKKKGVALVFVVSPKFTKVDKEYYDVFRSLAEENGIPFLDYHTIGLYQDHPEYFKDQVHLWNNGAKLFTTHFSKDLKMIVGYRLHKL